MLVREAILRQSDDEECTWIRAAFNKQKLNVFKHLTPMCCKLEPAKIDELALMHIEQGQPPEVCETVKRFAPTLLLEFHHFLTVYGFSKEVVIEDMIAP